MKTTNLRKTNLYESTKSICTSAFAFLLICIPKKIGTSRSLSRFFRGSTLLTLLTLLTLNSSANNLAITGVTVAGTTLTFTISWDNSWRVNTPPYNWDAVWVFVKYAVCDGSVSVWQHAGVSTDVNLYTFGGGATNLEFETVSDGMGVFIKRSATNMGGPSNISATVCNVPLTIAPGTYNFKVFGIEMVKIKQENFHLGDNAASPNSFTNTTIDANYETNGIGGNASTIIGGSWTTTSSLPPAYPLGYDAFYCMKYEITQEQYVDFLNSLTYDQQASRTALAPNSPGTTIAMYASASILYRNGIKIKSSGSAVTTPKTPAIYDCDLDGNNAYGGPNDGQNVACAYLLWKDLTGYLDWAALRPFTDIEFEKICRGPQTRLSNEFAGGDWGLAYAPIQTLSNAGAYDEKSANTDRSYNLFNYFPSGPVRVGFAAANYSAPATRAKTGATYYGVLDMTGNVFEQVVTVNDAGRTFTGTLGNGTLTAAGDADVANWPAGPSAAGGRGLRGGAFNQGWCCWTNYGTVSDRQWMNDPTATRVGERGGRGVR